jgi:endonuclease YncB( thermonuclease family)
MRALAGFLLALLGCVGEAHAADIVSYAIVQEAASLRMQGRTIRLRGIYIPDTGRICGQTLPPCGPRAVLLLRELTGDFVRCRPAPGKLRDGSVAATCYVGAIHRRAPRPDRPISEPPIDLAEQLLWRGLAVALPGAPVRYHAIERVARTFKAGIWGKLRVYGTRRR